MASTEQISVFPDSGRTTGDLFHYHSTNLPEPMCLSPIWLARLWQGFAHKSHKALANPFIHACKCLSRLISINAVLQSPLSIFAHHRHRVGLPCPASLKEFLGAQPPIPERAPGPSPARL